MKSSTRPAFTLLEVLIMSAVGLMLLGIVYTFFISSSHDSTKMSRKLQAIQASHLFLERLENDLKQAFYLKGIYDLEVYDKQGGRANGLCFFRVEPRSEWPEGGEAHRVKIERVEYVFSPVTARVYINGKPFTGGMFKRVEFRYDAGSPEADTPVYGDLLTVTVSGIPDELAGRDIADIDERSLSTLVTSFSFRARAIQRYYTFWNTYRPVVANY